AAITGFIAGVITSGTFKGGVIGALTAIAVAGVVEAYSTAKAGKGLASPEKLVPDKSTLHHLHGGGAEKSGLYRIRVALDGEFRGAELIGSSQIVSDDAIFVNGVMNDFSSAVKNGTIHLHQSGLLKTSYVLNYNPTQGFLTDLLEASKDIVGAHTGLAHSGLARDLAGLVDSISNSGMTGIHLVGHSQGGAITASALRFAQKSGMNLSALSSGGVSLNGAPVNAWLARERLGARYGVQIVSRHQFGDAVHVLGGLNLTNPLEIPVALMRAPALFSGDPSINPHSMPCGKSTMMVCGY
ncbi:MAG: hypothetical protein HKO99_02105, partial [Xanthomonadales bacterium]|nr:hypothetical protein [Xanthomonadales bacterium]